ncbi:MAG TPA: VOC family protein [Armatimonadota bacterium]|nr:VOC family protein [Armatimonadota bacterium]
MIQSEPLIAVRDVESSSLWYRRLLGCQSGHGGREYERILDGDRIVLQLHDWNAHEHLYLGNEASRPYGNGVSLWFRLDDLDAGVERAKSMGAEILEGPAELSSSGIRACWIRDPDGYVVVLRSQDPSR